MFGQTCGNCRQLFCLLAGHGCGLHPAFPAPSHDFEGGPLRSLGHDVPRECERVPSWLFDKWRCGLFAPASCPAKARHPVCRGLSAQALLSLEHWVARQAGPRHAEGFPSW